MCDEERGILYQSPLIMLHEYLFLSRAQRNTSRITEHSLSLYIPSYSFAINLKHISCKFKSQLLKIFVPNSIRSFLYILCKYS